MRGNENKGYIKAMRELRRSNAATPHRDKRSKRARTRQARTRKAVNDQKED